MPASEPVRFYGLVVLVTSQISASNNGQIWDQVKMSITLSIHNPGDALDSVSPSQRTIIHTQKTGKLRDANRSTIHIF